MSDYAENTPYEGDITPEVISYIFEDKKRTKIFSKVISRLTSKQKEYFKLYYGIKETSDGEYEYSSKMATLEEIASVSGRARGAIYNTLTRIQSIIKKDRYFTEIMSDYKEIPVFDGSITPNVIKYIFEDESRIAAFQKVLGQLTPKQRKYFEMHYGIAKTIDGRYKLTGLGKTYRKIADEAKCHNSNIYTIIKSVENQLKKDSAFAKIMQNYEEIQH